jgi:Cu(I)/Ag(I) efflux system membrane fusion protein
MTDAPQPPPPQSEPGCPQPGSPSPPSKTAGMNPAARNAPPWPQTLVFQVWRWRVARGVVVGLALLGVFGFGWLFARITASPRAADAAVEPSDAGPAVLYWTCSMHPQIKLPKFGQCPICFMDLVPVEAGQDDDDDAPVLSLSPRARMLARIETAEVRRRELTHDIHMVGKVAADETRITTISSYVPGRIDRLFVNYTGIFVRKGDHLTEIYSPELLVAQTEYLTALEALERAAGRRANTGETPVPRGTAQEQWHTGPETLRALLEASQRKMELWGVPEDEIERLRRERQPSDHMRVDAPLEGWVLERHAFLGMYLDIGTRLFTLADLRTVWVMLDAYELDLGFLRHGQTVRFETEAFPGRVFEATVSYIDPILDTRTRTVKVRVNVANPDVVLRPEMFVRARLSATIGEGGAVVDNPLAGKWVCPMHPENVRDGPDACDDCGMDLVTAESIGLAHVETPATGVLSVPESAVLLTGTRAIVYVEREADDRPVYEGRVVKLGPRAGEYYIVVDGLSEGERVVTRGALMIDSALQIRAKPSMMQPAATGEPDGPPSGPPSRAVAGAEYHRHVEPVLTAYFDLAAALADDDEARAMQAFGTLKRGLAQVVPHGLAGDDADYFTSQVEEITAAADAVEKPSMQSLRDDLPKLTAALEQFVRTFGHEREEPIVRIHCPMAFDDAGADWLQPEPAVRNPYFGKSMLRCGVVRATLGPDGREQR